MTKTLDQIPFYNRQPVDLAIASAEGGLKVIQMILVHKQKRMPRPYLDCVPEQRELACHGYRLHALYDLQRRGINPQLDAMPQTTETDLDALKAWHETHRLRPARRPDPQQTARVIQRQRGFIEQNLDDDVLSTKQTLLKYIREHEMHIGQRVRPVSAQPALWRPRI